MSVNVLNDVEMMYLLQTYLHNFTVTKCKTEKSNTACMFFVSCCPPPVICFKCCAQILDELCRIDYCSVNRKRPHLFTFLSFCGSVMLCFSILRALISCFNLRCHVPWVFMFSLDLKLLDRLDFKLTQVHNELQPVYRSDCSYSDMNLSDHTSPENLLVVMNKHIYFHLLFDL